MTVSRCLTIYGGGLLTSKRGRGCPRRTQNEGVESPLSIVEREPCAPAVVIDAIKGRSTGLLPYFSFEQDVETAGDATYKTTEVLVSRLRRA